MKSNAISAGRMVWPTLIVVILLLAMTLAAAWLGLLQRVQPVVDAQGQIGSFGPLAIEFSCPVDSTSLLEQVRISPPIAGSWQVEGRRAEFRPDRPLAENAVYRLELRRGTRCQRSLWRLPGAQIQFSARVPRIVFLGQASSEPELFLIQQDGSGLRQLTQTGGRVTDYSAARDGSRVVYSAENASGGADLWSLSLDQDTPRLLLDCGEELCAGPSLSPDGSRLAYSHHARSGFPRVWLLETATGKPVPLSEDPTVTGESPRWSSDGQKLSFYDPGLPGIRVWDWNGGLAGAFPTRVIAAGSWSADGERLWFTADDPDAFVPPVFLLEANLSSGESRLLNEDSVGLYEYGLPESGPEEGWLTVGRRPLEGAAGKQVWLIRLDRRQEMPVTEDVTYTHTNYTWSSGGRWLVYQRFRLGSSASRPEIAVWDRESGTETVLAADAAYPAWLP